MMRLCLLLFIVVLKSRYSSARECNPEDELPCLSKDCIHKMQWCDNSINCIDGSDERFCYVASCPAGLIRCRNGKCIPASARCNGYDNCGDGSDEECQRQTNIRKKTDLPIRDAVLNLNTTDAVAKAAAYLLKVKELDDGWKSFTPRAIVALAFAARTSNVSDKLISTLRKELNINILLNFMQRQQKPNLGELAHCINALYATCQDPHNYKGVDLVKLLRSEVDDGRNLVSPFALLTLCIAKSPKHDDTFRLFEMFGNVGNRISSKALIVMALSCISNSYKNDNRIKSFVRNLHLERIKNADIYTKILNIQALHALGYKTYTVNNKRTKYSTFISTYQLPDGSFGDLLSTYYAIPALQGKSLLDLKCENLEYEEVPMPIHLPDNRVPDRKKVTYSLMIDKGAYANTHSITITLDGNVTFYDFMRKAEEESSTFSFMYDLSSNGKKVYSLASIPNDAETGNSWNLYKGYEGRVKSNSKEHLSKLDVGVDRIWPKSGDHFVFWFERSLSYA